MKSMALIEAGMFVSVQFAVTYAILAISMNYGKLKAAH